MAATSSRSRATKRVILNGPVPDASAANATQACLARSAGSATLAGTALSLASQCAGDAMNRLVRLIGMKESGSLVVSSTVMSSILRALRRVGIRDAVTPTWLASKCGASLSSTLRTFQTTASALKADPSWNFTPGRSLKVHLVRSLASTAHEVARPGISTLASSFLERSQWVSASYIGMPVNRLPSKPWSGWPSVRGMSAAVIAIRSVFSWARAVVAPNVAASTTADVMQAADTVSNRPVLRTMRVSNGGSLRCRRGESLAQGPCQPP